MYSVNENRHCGAECLKLGLSATGSGSILELGLERFLFELKVCRSGCQRPLMQNSQKKSNSVLEIYPPLPSLGGSSRSVVHKSDVLAIILVGVIVSAEEVHN